MSETPNDERLRTTLGLLHQVILRSLQDHGGRAISHLADAQRSLTSLMENEQCVAVHERTRCVRDQDHGGQHRFE